MDFNQSIQQFEMRYKKEQNVRAKTRLHVLLLRRQKYSQQEIAAITRITQGSVSNICRRYITEGWNSVYDKPRDGRPARLTKAQKEILRKKMCDEIADGEIRRGWQTKDVRLFLKEQFNRTFTVQHTRRIMHKMGMTWKVPRPQHKNQNKKDVITFKKTSPGRYYLWQMSTKSSA
jgi:transposase